MLKVLVPRPRGQAEAFAAALRAEGLEAVVAEVTRIVAADPAPLDRALRRRWRWVAFASANAVAFTLARGRPKGRVAAVGDRTAEALRKAGLAVDLVAAEKTGAGLARALAAAGIKRARILVPHAAEGRDDLADGLRAAGARVTVVAAYRNVPLAPAELAPLVARLVAGDIGAAAFFAPSQVAPLAGALDRVGLIAAIGPTTADALRAAGARVDVVAPEPTAEALARAIALRYKNP
ncbi:MAG TPA: uroporphyrinogen-III synthase [Haliangiales bacterium]|nr:uroporphyrinogen-III synthase [Haliangiales bacterium]